ncbi:MAG TPA: hypothetical protein VFZ43_04990 [Anaerolineales bacterium]
MVEITYLAIAGIALAAMFFGYGFGLFEGRSQGYKKGRAEVEQQERDLPAPQPVTVTEDDPSLLRIQNENGLLTLDLDGTRVDTSSLSPEQRKRLIEMLNLMRPWLEGQSAPAPSAATPPSRQSGQPRPAPEASAPPAPKSTPQPSPALAPGASVDSTHGKPAPPQPKASPRAKDDRPSAPANSIISQIDAILQARMAGTPLEGRRVFLTQSPDGGVIVYVGLTRYMSVDDVPDAEVKATIRAAISEWENKYTPGL